jgi:glutathionyl-hydroquinone reductase
MGLLIDGAWHDEWYDTARTGGRFTRQDSAFRNRVTSERQQASFMRATAPSTRPASFRSASISI